MQPLWKTLRRFLKKLKIELPYDPVVPLLGIYPQEMKLLSWRVISTPMLITALFTVAETWKPLRCPSTKEWIQKIWYTHNGILLSHKKEILPFVTTWMNLEGITLSEIRQRNADTVWFHIHGIQNSWIHRNNQGLGDRGKGDMTVKVYKLPVIRGISSGDLTSVMVTTINNTVLHTWKWLRE